MGVAAVASRLPRPVRVAVASDQALVAEAVSTALRNRELEPLMVRWPRTGSDPVATARRRRRTFRPSAGRPPDVGLVLSDLTCLEQVRAAQTIVAALPLPWLVMAGVPRGAAWGALYEGGATLVVPSETGLVEVSDLLADLSAGRKRGAHRRERRELIEGWHSFAAQRSDLTDRMGTLTDREEEILHQLHQGFAVRAIAEHSAVAEATVRSQVKAILKKLDVNSQMAAVAAYQDIRHEATDLTVRVDRGCVDVASTR